MRSLALPVLERVLRRETLAFAFCTLSALWISGFQALLDSDPSLPLRGGVTLPSLKGRLRLEGVAFRYPTRPDVEVAEKFAGSGKFASSASGCVAQSAKCAVVDHAL